MSLLAFGPYETMPVAGALPLCLRLAIAYTLKAFDNGIVHIFKPSDVPEVSDQLLWTVKTDCVHPVHIGMDPSATFLLVADSNKKLHIFRRRYETWVRERCEQSFSLIDECDVVFQTGGDRPQFALVDDCVADWLLVRYNFLGYVYWSLEYNGRY